MWCRWLVTGGSPPWPRSPGLFQSIHGVSASVVNPGWRPAYYSLLPFIFMSRVLPIGSLTRGSLHSPVRSGNLPGTVPLRPRVAVIHRHACRHVRVLLHHCWVCLDQGMLPCNIPIWAVSHAVDQTMGKWNTLVLAPRPCRFPCFYFEPQLHDLHLYCSLHILMTMYIPTYLGRVRTM